MNDKTLDENIIKTLQSAGLNNEESLVYKTLLKYSHRGATVRQIKAVLPIERTTIYSILGRLLKKGFIFEKQTFKTSKMAKLFVCLEPLKLYNQLLSKKKEDFDNFKELRDPFVNHLEKIYLEKDEIPRESINPFFLPYIDSLLKKNWKVRYQGVKETFMCNSYEYYLSSPKAGKILPYNVFNVYVYNKEVLEEIEIKENFELTFSFFKGKLILKDLKDQVVKDFRLYYFLKHMDKKIPKDEILNEYNLFEQIRFVEQNIKIDGNVYPSLVFEIKPDNMSEYKEIINSALIFHENKLFFIWSKNKETLKELFKCISDFEDL